MPPFRWMSRTCGECRKGRVKCDVTQPVCARCQRKGLSCERPYQDHNTNLQLYHRVNTLAQAGWQSGPSAGLQYQIRLLSSFLSDYIPTKSGETGCQTSLTWFECLPDRLGSQRLVDVAVTALSLIFIGRKYNDLDLISWSHRYYGLLITELRRLNTCGEEVIAATMILAVYELYNPARVNHSWILHVQSACRLLEERGPDQPIDKRLLCRVRTAACYDGLGRRKASILGHPKWRAISPKNEHFDHALNILLCVPAVQEHHDKLKQAIIDRSAEIFTWKQLFLSEFISIYSSLQEWYLAFLNQQTMYPFLLRPRRPGDLFVLRNHPDLLNVFPEVVTFPNPHIAQTLLLAWMAFATLYTEAAGFMKIMHDPTILLTSSLPLPLSPSPTARMIDQECALTGYATQEQIEQRAEALAVRLCQVTAFCDQFGYGSAMRQPCLPSLWTAQQFFKTRARCRVQWRWCWTVMQNFQAIGSEYDRELGGRLAVEYGATTGDNFLTSG